MIVACNESKGQEILISLKLFNKGNLNIALDINSNQLLINVNDKALQS